MVYAFNGSVLQTLADRELDAPLVPRRRGTTRRCARALALGQGRAAATAIALVLGSAASFAIHRFRFFGRESISFLLLLPLALPGIITGMALNSFYVVRRESPFSI